VEEEIGSERGTAVLKSPSSGVLKPCVLLHVSCNKTAPPLLPPPRGALLEGGTLGCLDLKHAPWVFPFVLHPPNFVKEAEMFISVIYFGGIGD
jgi:hypothetical protein